MRRGPKETEGARAPGPRAGEILLTASRLDKSFDERKLCDGIALGVASGERLGIVGANGAGKSTLLAMLAGEEPADGGRVVLRSGVETAYLPQVPRFDGLTLGEAWSSALAARRGREDRLEGTAAAAAEGLEGWDEGHRVARIAGELGLAGLAPTTPVADLSGGQAKRLAVGRLALLQPDLVFLDEPTNHLDTEAIVWLETWLARAPRAAVVVTHDRAFLEAVVGRMAELEGGRLHHTDGSYAEYVAARAEREAQEVRACARRAQILRAEVAWACRSPRARSTRPEARLRRLAALQAQAPAAAAAAIEVAMPGGTLRPASGRVLLTLRGVQAAVPGGRVLFAPLSISLQDGERVAVVGPNGVGKSTLLRLMAGTQAPSVGHVRAAPRIQVATFGQHRTDLDPGLTVAETLAPGGGQHVVVEGRALSLGAYLQRFGFRPQVHGLSVRHLSGGEQSRLALAKFLLTDAAILLLDEPTNDLDLLTLSILEDALMTFRGALVVVSHDRFFLDKVATRTILFVADGRRDAAAAHRLVVEPGPPARAEKVARDLRAQEPAQSAKRASPAKTPKEPQPMPPPVDAGRRPLTFTERHRIGVLEADVAAAEAEVAGLQAALADPGLWLLAHKVARSRELGEALKVAEARLEGLMTEWAHLAERDDRT